MTQLLATNLLAQGTHVGATDPTKPVESIYGFRRCLELYVQDDELIKMKKEGKILMKKDYGVWKKDPYRMN